MAELELQVTLQPSFEHFERFANDPRIQAIRFNSTGLTTEEVEKELEICEKLQPAVPVYFDVKGRQLRVTEVHENDDHLDISLNHPIEVDIPTPVLFKAGADNALLEEVIEDGHRLIFRRGGPEYLVRRGESLHIRDSSLRVFGPQFTELEHANIEAVKSAGWKRWFLSYVQSQEDVDEFVKLVGEDSEVFLKIEDKKGLAYVENEFEKKPNLKLVAARGDMYVEIDRPHEILPALKLIISKDPEACAGSRLLLSIVDTPTRELQAVLRAMNEKGLSDSEAADIMYSLIRPTVPAAADFSELAWMYDIGYRKILLCDEICVKEDLLASAVNAFDSFRESYPQTVEEKFQLSGGIWKPK